MRRGQTTVEFLMILGVALLILLVTITISNEQGSALSTRKAELQASLAATDIGNAAREVYAQGIGARKLATVTLPRSYNASQSGVYSNYLKIRAGRTDYIETFPFPVSGSLPGRPGMFEFLVENDGGTVSIGRWLAYANASAIDATIYGGESYYESIALSSLSSTDSNVTIACIWEDGPVTIDCQNTSFALAGHASVPFSIGFSASEAAFGVHSGTVNVTVQGALGNQSIEIPVSVSILEVYGELSTKIVFLSPTPAKGTSITFAQLGVSPVVVNASISGISLSDLRYTVANSEYRYYDDSLVAMYNFDENAAVGESAGTVVDQSLYGNNASVYDGVRLLMHMDEGDGNTSLDGSAYRNNGIIYGNTAVLLHFDEGSGGTAYDESAYKNNGTCVGMGTVNGANACNWVTGKAGTGLQFGGDSKVVLNPVAHNNNSEETISLWVKPANEVFGNTFMDGKLQYLYTAGSGTGANSNYMIIFQNGTDVSFALYTSTYRVITAPYALSVGNWTHIVAVHSVSTGRQQLYVNGALAASGTTYADASTNHNYAVLGRDEQYGNAFSGALDEVGVYSRPLSSAEIADLYSAGKAKHTDWVAGRSGAGLKFDGVDDYALTGSSASLNISRTLSASAWVWQDSTAANGAGSTRTISLSGRNDGIDFKTGNDGQFIVVAVHPGGITTWTVVRSVPLNSWVHLAATFDGTNLKAYVNGALAAEAAANSSTININTNQVYLSSQSDGYSPFKGMLDEVAIYNRTLSPLEIFEQFSQGKATHPESVAGVYGNALKFDGLDDYLQGSISSPIGTGDYTLSAWYKRDSGYVRLFSQTSNVNYAEMNFPFVTVTSGGVFIQRDARASITFSYVSGTDWHQLVVTRQNGIVSAYVDSVAYPLSVDETYGSQSGYSFNSTSFYLQRFWYGGINYSYSGSVDEVRIWKRALSSAEVKQQYYSNLAKVSPDSWLFSSTHTQLDSRRYDYAIFAKDSNGQYDRASRHIYSTYNTIGFVPATPSSGASESSASLLYNPLAVNASIANAALSQASLSFQGSNYSLFDSSLVAAYDFDNKAVLGESPTLFADSSNNGFNGTCSGDSCPSIVEGKYGRALYFDGFEDYVNLTASLPSFGGTQAFAIEMWVSWSGETNSYQTLVSRYNKNVDGEFFLWLEQNGSVRFHREKSPYTVISRTPVVPNEWHHVTATYNGSAMAVYIDAVLEGSRELGSSGSASTTTVLLGSRQVGGEPYLFYDGSLDAIRIYNRSLSSDEVALHYYSNLAKYDNRKWLLASNPATPAGAYSYAGFALDSEGWNSTGTRSFSSVYNRIGFIAPTPANGSTANLTAASANGITLNVSVADANLSQLYLEWDGINTSFYDDSLAIAYNFDNNSALGDTDERVVDLSRYGNAGGVASNALTLHFDEGDGAFVSDSGPNRINPVVYGDTVLLLRMNESTGSVAYDNSRFGNNGTCYSSGAVSDCNWSSGRNGNGVYFDGTDLVNMSRPSGFDFGSGDFSAEAWVKTSSVNPLTVIANRDESSASYWHFRIAGTEKKLLVLTKSTASSAAYHYSNLDNRYLDGNWHHVSFVRRAGSAIYFYLDGQPAGSVADEGHNVSNPDNLYVGGYGGGYLFNGSIDEVAVYNRSLSPSEVLDHYNAGRAKFAEWDAEGKSGSAIQFDGVDDYVDLSANAAALDLATGTLSLWFKASSARVAMALFGAGDTTTDAATLMLGPWTSTYHDESLGFYVYTSSSYKFLAFVRKGEQYYADGDWHQVAVVVGSSYNKIYVDGIEENLTYAVGNASIGSYFLDIPSLDSVSIARRGYPNNPTYFNGSIDEVAITSRELTASEVWQSYAEGRPKHFDYADGKHGNALAFDGIDDYIRVSQPTFANLTMSAWVKPESASDAGIIGMYDNHGEYTGAFWYEFGNWYFEVGKDNVFQTQIYSPGKGIAGTWTHLLGTYNGTHVSFFVNGKLAALANETRAVGHGTYTCIGNVLTGCYSTASAETDNYFNGSIDEVRIWNRSMSAAEAVQHYYGNLAKHASDKWFFSTTAIANASGEYSYAAYLKDADGTWNSSGTRTVTVTNSTTVSFLSPTPAEGSNVYSSTYPVRAAVVGVRNLSSFHLFANDAAYPLYDDSLLLSLSFDNVTSLSGNATREVDTSRYGNNGSITGTLYPTAGRYGRALYFNGAANYITVPRSASLEPAGGLTVEAWVNPATYNMPDYIKQIVEKFYPDTSPTGYYLGMRCPDPKWTTSCARGVFAFEVRNGTQYSSNYAFASNVTIVPDTWYYVVGTAGNGVVSIYVNGELAASRPFAGSLNYADVRDMHIGADYVLTSGRFWNGAIDEVRVWGRALSAAEVQQHYNSNFAKYAPDKWLFESTVTGVHPGVEELRVLVRDSANNTYSDRRSIRAVSSQAQFSSPTPSEKRLAASIAAMPYYPVTVNATVSNISLANLTFQWGSSNVSFYNDSLVLAYNFDNVESIGEGAGIVKDVSRYGNNGAINGNTVVLLHADENSGSVIYDESKNRLNGTCYSGASATNCSFVAGISGTGLAFDGADDYVDLGSSAPGFASAATLSAWIRTNSTADVMNIVSRWTATSGKRGPRIIVSSGLLSFQATTDGEVTTAYGLTGLRRVSDGKWHHVAATYDGSQIRLYVDGALDNSAEARKGILYSGSGNLVLGRQGTDSVQYFNGTIDEAAVYNRSLSASEVFDHYASGRAKHSDWTADGKYGGAMTFDGIDDYVYSGTAANLNIRNAITVMGWYKPFGQPSSDWTSLFGKTASWYIHSPLKSNYNSHFFQLYNESGIAVTTGAYAVPDNEWHQYAGTYDSSSGQMAFYVDGIARGYGTTSGLIRDSSARNMLVSGIDGRYINGAVDEVRIYNRSLSADEIRLQYYSNLAKYAPDQWLFTYSVPTDLAPIDYDYAVYANDFLADGVDWGAYSGRKRITPFTDRISFIGQTPANLSSISSATAAFEPVQLNASIGNASLSQATVNWNSTNLSLFDSSLVLMYNFDKVASIGDNSSYVVDSSLYANNGTALSMVNFSSDGPFGKAASFDGVWDYITAPSSSSLNFGTGDFAVAFWMKPVKFNTPQGVVRKMAPETLWGDGWFIESTGDASNTIRFETRPNDAVIRSRRVNSSSAIPSGVWTYVTAVRAGTFMRIYLNGMLDAENATGVIDNVTSNASVIVGSSPQDSDRYFDGSIDEVRIWNRSLNGREVYESYKSNLAHTGPGRWALSANKSVAGVNGYSFYGFAGEPSGSNVTATRTFSTSNNRIGFISPTPADGSTIPSSVAFANGIQINTSVVNSNLSAFKFSWNGTAANYFDDNLVLAYNFDNLPAAGDSAQRVTDYSRYKNNGTASSALLTLHFDGEDGSTAYDSAGGSNGLIYGDTALLLNFDEAEGKSVSDKSRFANPGTVYGNTRLLLHFDEGTGSVTYDDSAFQNNATCYNMNGSTGATPCNWSVGKSGAGISFDGADDYLIISNSNSLTMSTNDLTLEAWVKRNDNPADNPGILAKKNAGGADANSGYAMGVLQGGSSYGSFKPWMSLGDGTNYEDYRPTNSGDIVPLGQWTHVAAVYSFSSHSAQFYINGVPVATTKSSSGNITNLSESNNMLIGKANYAAYNLNGSLDEIGVYSKALPASEILAHYAAGKAKHSDWVAGKNGTGIQFDASSFVLVAETSASLSGNTMAIEAWVKPFLNSSGTYGTIVNDEASYELVISNTGKVMAAVETTAAGAWDFAGPLKPLQNNTWSHVAFVYDGTTWKFYINGTLESMVSPANGQLGNIIPSALNLRIGGRYWDMPNGNFSGVIDEVAIYNRSITADEVAAHYAAGRARLLERGEGRVGDGLVLNGTGEYLNVVGPVSGLQVNSPFTFSGWMRPSQVGYTNPIIEWGAYWTGKQGIRLEQRRDGILYGFAGSGSVMSTANSDSALPFDKWMHFAFGWNGTHVVMFINGVLQSTKPAFAGPINYSSNTVNIGRQSPLSFNGSLDEFALYNQSLSASEILQMYEEGVPKHLNYVEGRYGNAVQFDGVSDFVNIPATSSLSPASAVSIGAWMKWNGGANNVIVIDRIGSNDGYGLWLTNANRIAMDLNGGSAIAASQSPLIPGQWYHITGTYDKTYARIYVNGVLEASTAYAADISYSPEPNFRLGYDNGNNRYFNGSIDEVRIWNRSLTASEISQHYYSNLAKYSADRWLFSSSPPIASAGNYSFSASMKDVAGSWNSTGTRTVQVAQSNPVGFAPPTPADGSDLYGDSVQVKGTLSNVSSLDTLKLLVGDSVTSLYDDSLVLAYNFDNVASIGENAAVAVDVSRTGNNGTLLNGTAWSSGKYGGGLAFDGANDFVLVNSPAYMFNSGSFSATVWANAAALDGGYDGLLTVDVAGDESWKIKRDAGNTYFRGRYASTTLDYPAVNVNEWHQYGLVKSGTTLSIYFDGALVTSAACAATHALSGTRLVIGSYRVNDAYGGHHLFNGSMDEVRIWNRSLSASEIQQQYNSNLAKFAQDEWLFQSNQSGLSTRQYEVRAFARDTSNNTYSDRRFFNAYANKISFSSPTPQKRFFSSIGAGAVEPFAINASIRNISLSSMTLNFNGTNHTFYNDSLVLAYNFDDVASIGDSVTKVVDVSKYGNNGTIYGNTALLLRMDEGNGNIAFDESRFGNNGTCYNMGGGSGATTCNWVAGTSGTGIGFDGVDDYAVSSAAVSKAAMLANGMTLSAWVKSSTTTGMQIIANQDTWSYCGNSCDGGIQVSSGKAKVSIYNVTDYIQRSGTTTVADGRWHHVVGTFTPGAVMTIYVDGIAEGSKNFYTYPDYVARNISIGRLLEQGRNLYGFNGSIDEVLIANRSLSADEVLSHYNAGKAKHADWVYEGKVGSGINFDGADDYVSAPDSDTLDLSSEFTISAWVNASLQVMRTIASKQYSYAFQTYSWSSPMRDGLKLTVYNSTDNDQVWAAKADYVQSGWKHVAVTFKNGESHFYYNGEHFYSSTKTIASANVNSNPLMIGTSLDGGLDEVRIWNRSLSSEEIAQQYYGSLNKYAPDKWVFSSVQSGPSTSAGVYNYSLYSTDASGAPSFSGRRVVFNDFSRIGFVSPTPASGSAISLASASTGQVLINASIAGVAAPRSMGFTYDGASTTIQNDSLMLAYNFDDVASIGDSAAKVVDVSKYGNNGTVYGSTMLLMHMDEGTSSVAYDEGVYRNNATCYNSSGARTCSWVQGKSGSGISFDGVSDYASIPSSSSLSSITDQVTWGGWFKLSFSGDYQRLVNKGDVNAGTPQYGFELTVLAAIDNRTVCFLKGSNDLISIAAAQAANTTFGQWAHMLCVYNGTNNLLYINGILAGSSSVSAGNVNTTNPIYIGRRQASVSQVFSGLADEILVANRSLSASEVLAQYDAGKAKHANWDPDGKWNSAMKFDGVDDYVLGPSSSTVNVSGEFTLSAWANTSDDDADSWFGSGMVISPNGYSRGYYLSFDRDTLSSAFYDNDGNPRDGNGYIALSAQVTSLQGWNYITSTYSISDRKLKLYLNGNFVSSLQTSGGDGAIPYASYYIKIGSVWTGGAYFNGSIDEVRIWNRSMSASEIQQQYYSNLAKYAPDKWLFSYRPSLNSTGSHTFSASVRDDAYVSNYSETRSFTVSAADKIAFIAPTPADGANARFGSITINASIANLSLSKMVFSWNGTNYSYLDSSLVLAYNFDDNTAAGDTAGKAVDYSGYGNNGTISGNTPLLLHMDEADGNTTKDESVYGSNGAIYGNTVALLRMNEGSGNTTYDESAYKNNGTCVYRGTYRNCNWTVGRSGTGIYFEAGGSTYSYVSLGAPASLNTIGAFAVSAWVNFEDYGADRDIYSKGYLYSAAHGIDLRRYNNDHLRFIVGNGASITAIDSDGNLTANTWHHVVGVFNGTHTMQYVDGVKQATMGTVSAPVAFEADTTSYLGGYTGWFKGSIDEVAIYNRSISPNEVTDIYNYGKAKHIDWTTGKSGSGLQFDGVNDYVQFSATENLKLSTGGSVEAWINIAKLGSSYANTVFFKGSGASWANMHYVLFEYTGTDQMTLGVANDVTSTGTSGPKTASLVENRWYHVAGTWNATTKCIYLDGVPTCVDSPIMPKDSMAGTSVFIGKATGAYYMFNGTIDELVVTNRSLTAAEVSQHYAAGKAHHDSWDQDGKWGSAMKFDGVDDYVNASNSTSLCISSNLTLSAWVKSASSDLPSGRRYRIIDKYYGSGYGLDLLDNSGRDAYRLFVSNGAVTSELYYYAPMPTSWTQVTGTYNGSAMVLYVNGTVVNSTSSNVVIRSENRPLSIGAFDSQSGYFFNGSIDEVRVWNRALSADEIRQQYYSNLAKVGADRWIFTSSQTFSPTGSSGLPYSIWVRDANTWNTNQTARVVKRE